MFQNNTLAIISAILDRAIEVSSVEELFNEQLGTVQVECEAR
jgi:hypothetical protein